MASNDEILTLFGSIQDQMKQQQETKQIIMREIQLLKSNSKRPAEDTVTPLQPRALNFSSAVYTEDNQGNILPSRSQSNAPEIPSAARMSTVRGQDMLLDMARITKPVTCLIMIIPLLLTILDCRRIQV